jgi:hypothetical protein
MVFFILSWCFARYRAKTCTEVHSIYSWGGFNMEGKPRQIRKL